MQPHTSSSVLLFAEMLRAALILALSSTAMAVFECSSQETTAFVRIARARLDGTPVVVSTAGMLAQSVIFT